MSILNDNIKAARMNSGKTLEEVSLLVGVSRQTIQKYESGVISNIPSDKIEKLADVFNTSPAYLMGWNEPENMQKSDDTNQKAKIKSHTLGNDNQPYFLNDEAREIAEELSKNPDLHILFDAAREVSAEDLQFVVDIMNKIKKK